MRPSIRFLPAIALCWVLAAACTSCTTPDDYRAPAGGDAGAAPTAGEADLEGPPAASEPSAPRGPVSLFGKDVTGKSIAVLVYAYTDDEKVDGWLLACCKDGIEGHLVGQGYRVKDQATLNRIWEDARIRKELRNPEISTTALLDLHKKYEVDLFLRGSLRVASNRTAEAGLTMRCWFTGTAGIVGATKPYVAESEVGDVGLSDKAFSISTVVEVVMASVCRNVPLPLRPGHFRPPRRLKLTLQAGDWSRTRRAAWVCFSPNGRYLAVADGGGAAVYSLEQRGTTVAACRTASAVTRLAASGCTGTLALGCKDGSVWRWDWLAKRAPRRIGAMRGRVTALAFNEDGTNCAVGSSDGRVTLFALDEGGVLPRELVRKWKGEPVTAVRFLTTPAGREQLLATEYYGEMKRWDSKTGAPAGTKRFLGERPRVRINCADVSGFGGANDLVTLGVKDIHIDRLQRRRTDLDYVYVLFASSLEKHMEFQPHVTALGGYNRDVTAVAMSRWLRFLATGNRDGTVAVWDLQRGEDKVVASKEKLGEVHSVAISPHGQFLAAASAKGVFLWKTK